MRPSAPPRAVAVLSAALLILTSCVDSGPVGPADHSVLDVPGPSGAVVDGTTTGDPDFYFLPPLVTNPNPTGTFNPNLLPAMRVCERDGTNPCPQVDPHRSNGVVAYFPPGSFEVGDGQYQLGWDTDGPETLPMKLAQGGQEVFYRLQIEVGGDVVGALDLDPQDPQGPGQATSGFYAFRLGETIPVKIWLDAEYRCDPAGYVTECITGAVLDQTGGTLALDQGGDRLSVYLPPNALPGIQSILVVVERLDPDAFLAATGEECLPFFDAPQFGPCFRITTDPVLSAPLLDPALVSICIDPSLLDGLDIPAGQEDQLQITRFATDGSGVIQGLENVPGDCPVSSAAAFPVPESGPMRYLAMGANAVAAAVLPAPLAAHGDISLGGMTSSFSRFRFALPGQMTVTAGDGGVLQAADAKTVDVSVHVVDHEGIAVENARVHFAASAGSPGATEALTDASGDVTVTWDLTGAPEGTHTLTASARGLLAGPVPDHNTLIDFTAEAVTASTTVVGPPAAVSLTAPTGSITGTAGEPVDEPIVVTITDAGGVGVAGAGVSWSASGDGSFAGDAVTGADGTASGVWTLATAAGANTATVTSGGATVSFSAQGEAGEPALISASGDGQTGLVGTALAQPLGILVTDQHGNPVPGAAVSWSTGDGTLAGDATTGDGSSAAAGSAAAAWTLGTMPGARSATAAVGAVSHTFTATGECFDGYGTAVVDGSFGDEWVCARSEAFTASLSGGSTPASVHWMNDGTNLYLAVRVQQATFDRKNTLRIDFDNDADGLHEENDDAIGYDADANVFFDEYLTAKCANSGQSGCGKADGGTPDGAGAAGNDGAWTTFELVHPLSSGDARDFSLTAGDAVGFFLTVQVGNGAQGNTQHPGFRVFRSITVEGTP